MTTELARQIRALLDEGAAAISPGEARDRAYALPKAPATGPVRGAPRLWPRWAAVTAAGLVAVACGTAVAMSLGAGPFRAAGRARGHGGVLLTAAQLRRVTTASTAALARSARAYITYGGSGPDQAFRSEYIAYSGEDYSFAGSVINTAPGGRPGQVAWFAARVVDGQAYAQVPGNRGWRWYHYPGPAGGRAEHALDPRALLRVLTPAARFRFAGRAAAGDMRLQAGDPARVAELPALAGAAPGQAVAALSVLVDRRGVVRQVTIGLRGATLVAAARIGRRSSRAALASQSMLPYGAPGSAVVTVTFADFGRPQVITAPPHAVDADTPWGLSGRPLPPQIRQGGTTGS
jgi:hypothetical protein